MPKFKSEIKNSIHEYLLKNPKETTRSVAQRFKISESLVSLVRRESGLPPRKRMDARAIGYLSVSNENFDFLVKEAASLDITFQELIEAIITDARLEAT